MSRAVIDQPGIRIVIIGLVLSIFIGLALRSQISDSRLQVYLNKSVDRLQRDFYIDYEDAKVNLSRWGLPLPSLVVRKIRLSPKSILCQSSQIYIDELEVPVSISTILGLSKTLPRIRIKEVELRLSDIDKCIGQRGDSDKETTINVAPTMLIAEPLKSKTSLKNIFTNKTRAELKEIYIENLKIISSKNPSQPILLKHLSIELFYAEKHLAEARIKSKINALKDARSDVFFLNSDLVATFKANNNNNIESFLSINGKLLDGDVKFFTHSFSESKEISYEVALKHVSVKALTPILEHVNSEKNIIFDKMPISISFNNTGKILLNNKANLESKFKDVHINIEDGYLNIDELNLKYSDSHLFIKPFLMKLESLPLSNLKYLEQYKNKLDSFESLGYLSGLFDYRNESLYKITGSIKNIQAVFSNSGRRDLQNIEYVEIAGVQNSNILKIEATNFVINNKRALGKFWFTQNTKNTSAVAQLKISGATLNNKIWEQFTFVEQSPKIGVFWDYKRTKHEIHNLKINIDKIDLPGARLTGLNIDINQKLSRYGEENNLSVAIRPTTLITNPDFFKNEVISQIFNTKNGFELITLGSRKTSLVFSGNNWRNINFNLDSYISNDSAMKSKMHLSLIGSVKDQQGLSARLLMKRHKSVLKFDLSKKPDNEVTIDRMQ